MSISLKDVTKENWMECINLRSSKDKVNSIFEEFVASNAFSIAQSKIEEEWVTKAIYDNETLIGFTMYGFYEKYKFYEISRLMIDYKFQQRGYGTQALLKIIDEMKNYKNCKEIFLTIGQGNEIAIKIYKEIGFKDTGRIIANELVYKLEL